ncbi:MAG: hypothetical protein EOM50_15605 [Erysipelotrichia bacterium]|nr:hypothetical protein [Erysipelotrichia bacterium]NCC54216.1 hypothetical protein [Erysipelotrichia bacterium]
MSELTNNVYFQVVLIIAIVAYGLYNLIKVAKIFKVHLKTKQAFLEKAKGKYEKQQDYTAWVVVYAIICVGAFVMMVVNLIGKDYMMAAAFFSLGVFCISFVMDALITRQAWFDEDGFFYEKKYYRYRSVNKVVLRTSLIASYDMYLTAGESVRISKKMGEMLNAKLKEHKLKKKNK